MDPDQRAQTKPRKPVTLKTIMQMARRGDPFACLACYDATSAHYLEEAGVHILLMGDTAAEVVLGFQRTISMPLEVSIALTAALKRGAPNTLIMADMPFMSYHASEDEAIKNAGRYMTEGMADVIKLEVDHTHARLVDRMSRAGIAICAHIGSHPQRAAVQGGYGSAGRTAAEAEQIVEDAIALEAAGAVMLLIEAVPEEVTTRVLEATSIPVIGIGAGTACHGQILVLHDLIGMSSVPPRFVDPVADLGAALTQAGRDWVAKVAQRNIGGKPYHMIEGEAQRLSNSRPPSPAPARS